MKQYKQKNIQIYNDDCLPFMRQNIKDNSIDLVVTSPPYNCGIDYNYYNDNKPWGEYLSWCQSWINECFRICKTDGRIAINVPVEIGIENNKRRVSPMCQFIKMIENSGFHLMGLPAWTDNHRVKYSAWGSWMKASSPYIYNPYQIIILGYKNNYKKQCSGISTISKEDFMRGCSGIWNIRPETKMITKCNFPVELPQLCINLLTYEGDVVFDPFSGGGTTGIACKRTNRKYIGVEIDEKYFYISVDRIKNYIVQEDLFK